MKAIVTPALLADDAEPILREAAVEAAKFGSLCDYITRKTYNVRYVGHGETIDDARKRWTAKYLRAKRIVEAFGVAVDQPSEGETLTVHVPNKNEKRTRVKVGGLLQYTRVEGGVPDYKNAMPEQRRDVWEEACRQAADRVVRRWRATLLETAA